MVIRDAYKKVPLMFQAQTEGRCQLQYVASNHAKLWVSEWVEKVYPHPPQWEQAIKTKEYQISWRFVTNSGQDSIIRPVIGSFGFPYYPGSSMKGVFLRSCTGEQAARYCGQKLGNGDVQPGILRFHGGYPIDTDWQDYLLDLVHPQQQWQVQTNNTRRKPPGESAFPIISLYQPTLKFGISSHVVLDDSEWEVIWQIWEQAMSTGLGCRVSAGYGQPSTEIGHLLYHPFLQGTGLASTTLDGEPEFRPNMFKAALRGHALRIFGGLTDANTATSLVETLFGGVSGDGKVGLVAINWLDSDPNTSPVLDFFEDGYGEPFYKVKGQLRLLLTRSISEPEEMALKNLLKGLTRFAMLLGGFGKCWRRVDHPTFYPDYYEGRSKKPLIGCHWQWTRRSHNRHNLVFNIDNVAFFIDNILASASKWMELQGVGPNSEQHTSWREAWHRDNVQVWGRVAEDEEDCKAIAWFHGDYTKIPQGSIYRTSLTGKMNQISRIWHRMYPLMRLDRKNSPNPKKPIVRPTRRYLELLTIFPNDSQECLEFLRFLESNISGFKLLWGNKL